MCILRVKHLLCDKAHMFTRNHKSPSFAIDNHSCALIVGEHIRRNVSAGTSFSFFFQYISQLACDVERGKAEAMVLTNAWQLNWIEAFLVTFHPFSILLQCWLILSIATWTRSFRRFVAPQRSSSLMSWVSFYYWQPLLSSNVADCKNEEYVA